MKFHRVDFATLLVLRILPSISCFDFNHFDWLDPQEQLVKISNKGADVLNQIKLSTQIHEKFKTTDNIATVVGKNKINANNNAVKMYDKVFFSKRNVAQMVLRNIAAENLKRNDTEKRQLIEKAQQIFNKQRFKRSLQVDEKYHIKEISYKADSMKAKNFGTITTERNMIGLMKRLKTRIGLQNNSHFQASHYELPDELSSIRKQKTNTESVTIKNRVTNTALEKLIEDESIAIDEMMKRRMLTSRFNLIDNIIKRLKIFKKSRQIAFKKGNTMSEDDDSINDIIEQLKILRKMAKHSSKKVFTPKPKKIKQKENIESKFTRNIMPEEVYKVRKHNIPIETVTLRNKITYLITTPEYVTSKTTTPDDIMDRLKSRIDFIKSKPYRPSKSSEAEIYTTPKILTYTNYETLAEPRTAKQYHDIDELMNSLKNNIGSYKYKPIQTQAIILNKTERSFKNKQEPRSFTVDYSYLEDEA